ncbi:ArsR/SmtB-type metalloregulator TsoR [Desulfurivibrio alkaliphilus]|uniref:Transcriptional regulator, ArsR family n=1 Tax=Desulfurivibrio alkaliphilus (strain DSM 19089 / UNIQEM U267 / AHT2) TaxID=589865 RepID=D6Z428_DESAT|nr:metalloregulator ArsR/SmtB family transcription factor [Desulfurivibrio alkaliphilus]ADH86303.1 transcriptional regulator, ArsR family [Desulfurivibrio alkaliphilus AHT 2]
MKNGNSNHSPGDGAATVTPADLVVLLKGLADENRLRILRALVGTEKPVSKLVEELGISQPLVSHHLKELRRALLVSVERRGPFVYCRLADPRLEGLLDELNSLTGDLLARRTSF